MGTEHSLDLGQEADLWGVHRVFFRQEQLELEHAAWIISAVIRPTALLGGLLYPFLYSSIMAIGGPGRRATIDTTPGGFWLTFVRRRLGPGYRDVKVPEVIVFGSGGDTGGRVRHEALGFLWCVSGTGRWGGVRQVGSEVYKRCVDATLQVQLGRRAGAGGHRFGAVWTEH